MRFFILSVGIILLSGCSVSGNTGTEIAPYEIVRSDDESNIELRTYEQLVLVSTPMSKDGRSGRNGAFSKLFDYISGNNTARSEIAMTAPVFMDSSQAESGTKIPMTAPVFMDDATTDQSDGSQPAMMSFVLPSSFTMKNAPLPNNPDVKLHALNDYTVASIRFSGFLSDSAVKKHKAILESWIEERGYRVIGPHKTAAYNAPFTLPAMRRNEVLIPVEKQ